MEFKRYSRQVTQLQLTIALSLALLVASPVFGDDGLSQPTREEVIQEMQLVKMLLTKSPLAESAQQKSNSQVSQPLELAQNLYTRANDALVEGNLVWATAFLDEALSLIEDAARLGSDPLQVETKQRARYAELLDDVRAFDATYLDVRKGMSTNDKNKYDAEVEPTKSLISRAQSQMRDGRYPEASDILEKVHAIYINVLNELLASTAFVYDKNFKTPGEEYEYEMARYHSYEELIPIAREQFKPDEYTLKLSDRFVQDALASHALAEKQAASGDHSAAIGSLQAATKRLQTSLRTIGLEVPE